MGSGRADYTGDRPWRPPGLRELAAPMSPRLRGWQPQLELLVLDAAAPGMEDGDANPVAALLRLQRCRQPAELPALTEALFGALRRHGLARLADALTHMLAVRFGGTETGRRCRCRAATGPVGQCADGSAVARGPAAPGAAAAPATRWRRCRGGRCQSRVACAIWICRTTPGAGFARVSLSSPAFPSRLCLGEPCWRGIEFAVGEPLALFARPLAVMPAPEPAALYGDALSVPLSSLVAAGEMDGDLAWRVSSSDPSVAAVRIVDGALLVEPAPYAEGAVRVEATATGASGQTATVRFEVPVDYYQPASPVCGWRGALPTRE